MVHFFRQALHDQTFVCTWGCCPFHVHVHCRWWEAITQTLLVCHIYKWMWDLLGESEEVWIHWATVLLLSLTYLLVFLACTYLLDFPCFFLSCPSWCCLLVQCIHSGPCITYLQHQYQQKSYFFFFFFLVSYVLYHDRTMEVITLFCYNCMAGIWCTRFWKYFSFHWQVRNTLVYSRSRFTLSCVALDNMLMTSM